MGVLNHLARRGRLEPGSELFGKALENLVHHELCAWREYHEHDLELSFWRLASGIEVDFLLGDAEVGIEARSSRRAADVHLAGLRALREDHRTVRRLILVCLEEKPRRTADGVDILPVRTFLSELWADDLV